jgi:hypothetical protein
VCYCFIIVDSTSNEHVLLNYFERAVTAHLTISSTRSLCTLPQTACAYDQKDNSQSLLISVENHMVIHYIQTTRFYAL